MTETERWHTLTLAEQLGNIGSEVGRAATWQGKNQSRFDGAVQRGLDLIGRTLSDPRWLRQPYRLLEIARLRELFAAAVLDDRSYHTTLADLDRYLMHFARVARTAT